MNENGIIRMGLSSIKGISKDSTLAIINSRNEDGEFKTLTDFINRTSSFLKKKELESLIKAGALSSLK